ncbi:MAG: hypothetical protein GWO24_17660, partial [Akkermansiaceae bacterium]|nr:hypothetical protein [Akkermansiaceae bacterium]
MAALKQKAPDLSAEKAARVDALIGEVDSLRREAQQKDARLASAEGEAGNARKEAEAARAELKR